MTRKFTFKKIAIAALMCAALPLSSSVADNHEGEEERSFDSKYRHDTMQHFNYSMQKLVPIIFRGTGNPDHLPAIAQIMASTATMTKSVFEKDTRGTEGFTKAKDAVWENWEDFAKRMDSLEADTAAFAEVTKQTTDMDEIKAAFGLVGRNCKGCHDEYKVR